MQLYTVHFTTKHVVSQFDDKGKKIGEYTAEIPQTINALPLSTCQGYKKFDNYRVEPYYADVSKRPLESKKQSFNFRGAAPTGAKKAPASSSVSNAAKTGDLAAAISAGARS